MDAEHLYALFDRELLDMPPIAASGHAYGEPGEVPDDLYELPQIFGLDI
jgi:hypothetical protein